MKKNNAQILEGSRAIALTIKNIKPDVISVYPITPQTHIVEDLAKLKADGEADYEYIRAESEFAAASIIEGASATGMRVYTATSSQGILLMTEVLFNIAGMRLPVVITCANRGISAPITIWNDQQDIMTVRDAGFLTFFAENHQEAIMQHILAYKVAEKLSLPAIVNIDGFVLTHSYEKVTIPTASEIKKFLPAYKPKAGQYLDPKNPRTFGAFATPAHYMEIRVDLHDDLVKAKETINKEYNLYKKTIKIPPVYSNKLQQIDNGLIEYYGPKTAKTVLISLGSLVGTIKTTVENEKNIGVLKIKTLRPFPGEEIVSALKQVKAAKVAIVEKAISLGSEGPLALDVKSAACGKTKAKLQSFVVGLGGRDITQDTIKNIVKEVAKKESGVKFMKK